MDEAGWAEIADVLHVLAMHHHDLIEAVETNDKGRLQIEGSRVRACQGHSLAGMPVTQHALESTWTPVAPEENLWHGTTLAAIEGIAVHGIEPAARSHVHLAPSRTSHVGKRASVQVLLEISPRRLAALGIRVFRAPNGVILARKVPVSAIIDIVPGSTEDPAEVLSVQRLLGLPDRLDDQG
jgi:putative RNA 2'-phosphotransferase